MEGDNYAILKTKLILQRPMVCIRSFEKKRSSINSKWIHLNNDSFWQYENSQKHRTFATKWAPTSYQL